ncbi:Uncharacterised protein [Salmonella enterica subsp. enterica serovar Typhi]|nr:Uncharacterised protein [Salmonella enterica subsp. enterica serovar Typhi]
MKMYLHKIIEMIMNNLLLVVFIMMPMIAALINGIAITLNDFLVSIFLIPFAHSAHVILKTASK